MPKSLLKQITDLTLEEIEQHPVWIGCEVTVKVFRSNRNWLNEFRIFARDEDGRIILESDFQLMAATRYLLMLNCNRMKVKPPLLSRGDR